MNFRKDKSPDTYVSPTLLFLVVVFVSFLMMSNILANQMLQLGPFIIDAGTLTFPVTYVLSDVFSEVYGYKWSRRVTKYAVTMNLILASLIMLSTVLPQPEWYDGSYFKIAVGGSLRIVIASIVSYWCGDFVNDRVFRFLKKSKSDLKGFGLRALASSLGGEIVDTTLFVILAFAFTMPVEAMLPMIAISVVLKTGYEVIVLPITYRVTIIIKMREEIYSDEI